MTCIRVSLRIYNGNSHCTLQPRFRWFFVSSRTLPNKHTTKFQVLIITNGTWTKSDRLRVYEEERGDWKQLEACRDKHLSHLFFSKMIRNIEDSSVVNSSCRGYIWLEEVFYQDDIWATEVFLSCPKPQVILTIFTKTWSCFNIECTDV